MNTTQWTGQVMNLDISTEALSHCVSKWHQLRQLGFFLPLQGVVISGLNRRHGAITGTDAAEGYVTIYAEVLKLSTLFLTHAVN